MRICVDAMGGDHAPEALVAGSVEAVRQFPDIEVVLTGDRARIESLLPEDCPPRISIVHTTEVIRADDEPVRAVRRKTDSSLVVAAEMVRRGEADGVVSAGNTGALMAAGLLIVGRMKGIERPALAPVFPTWNQKGLLVLDVGANMDAEPHHLVQYGRMGAVYARDVLGVEEPRVGLLNVGTEPGKGNQLTKAAYALLQESGLAFVGNVEARDMLDGSCDVLVCDGFVGNVLLKFLEGVAIGLLGQLKEALAGNVFAKLAAWPMKPALRGFRDRFDYTEYGGVPLLGVDGLCVKAHGSSNAKAIFHAVKQARQFLSANVLEHIRTECAKGMD
jgi:glycerol-3-phosphate acyltransferase PlsX